MTQKELKRLRRSDLVEMLLELSKENARLRGEIADMEARLNDRTIAIAQAGSLAEAVLELNGVFAAAQNACDQYIQNTKERCQRMEEDTRIWCDQMRDSAREQVGMYEKEEY